MSKMSTLPGGNVEQSEVPDSLIVMTLSGDIL